MDFLVLSTGRQVTSSDNSDCLCADKDSQYNIGSGLMRKRLGCAENGIFEAGECGIDSRGSYFIGGDCIPFFIVNGSFIP